MKRVLSLLSHVGVIWLALLALLIGTVVWLFERLRGRTQGGSEKFQSFYGREQEHQDPSTRVSRAEENAREPSLAREDKGYVISETALSVSGLSPGTLESAALEAEDEPASDGLAL